MDTWIYLTITLFYIALFGYGINLYREDISPGPRYLLFLVTAALIWDNGVMAAGTAIGESDTLKSLNTVRYWLHAFGTPLLAIVSFDLIRRAGSPWAGKPAALAVAWVFTAGLIAMELFGHTLSLELEPLREYGSLRYVPAQDNSGPPLLVILVMIPLLAAGILLWKRKVTSVLFWGTVAMLVGSIVPFRVASSAATNLFELALVASLWHAVRRERSY